MKFLMSTLMTIFAFSVFAQEGSFSNVKQQKLDHVDQKIELMNESRNCIVGAADRTALDECHADMRIQREELKDEYKEQREEFKDETKEDSQE